MTRSKFAAILLALCLMVPLSAQADYFIPSTFSYTATEFGTHIVKVSKTLVVEKGTPTTAKGDIFFLADTTGSMGSAIASVRTGASNILTKTAAFGDINWAVGEYKDFPTYPWGGTSDFPFKLNTALTSTQADVQTGINAWSASGGADGPESNLYALQQAATTTSWRTGSRRFLVQFGDIFGHDPDPGSGDAYTPGYPGPTEAVATAALTGNNVTLLALNVGYGQLDNTGQATRMTAATGGTLYNGIDPDEVADKILAALEAGFATYTTVGLDLSEVPDCFAVLVEPTLYTGSYSRETEQRFGFDIYFAMCCDKPGECTFNIYGLVDGGRVATEIDTFRCSPVVPIPGALLLLGGGLLNLARYIRRKEQ